MVKCGYFLPLKTGDVGFRLPVAKSLYKPLYINYSEEYHTVEQFLEALSKWQHDDAKVYISKNFANDFDLDELSRFFAEKIDYKNLIKVEFNKSPKNCKSNSILILDKDRSIVHLYLVKEPDKFGKWKIYSIEKE